MKQHVATKQTIKAIVAGVRLMLVKIPSGFQGIKASKDDGVGAINSFMSAMFGFKQGDEIFIAEEFGLASIFKLKVGKISIRTVLDITIEEMEQLCRIKSNSIQDRIELTQYVALVELKDIE